MAVLVHVLYSAQIPNRSPGGRSHGSQSANSTQLHNDSDETDTLGRLVIIVTLAKNLKF